MRKYRGFAKLKKIPLKDKIIHVHFFIGGYDWYIAEYDGDDLFGGYAILNGDTENAEWGYVSFKELIELNICGIPVITLLDHFYIHNALPVYQIPYSVLPHHVESEYTSRACRRFVR